RRKPSRSQGYNLRGQLDHTADTRCRRDNDASLGKEIENKRGCTPKTPSRQAQAVGKRGSPCQGETKTTSTILPFHAIRHPLQAAMMPFAAHSPAQNSVPIFRCCFCGLALKSIASPLLFICNLQSHRSRRARSPYLARADGPPKSLCQATGQAGEGVCSLSIKYQLVNVARHGDHGPSSKVENMAYSR
ncbi:hypothetical protein CPAR01_13476, partial [Colletotrichum paranaense]